jgi:hypothetical protein
MRRNNSRRSCPHEHRVPQVIPGSPFQIIDRRDYPIESPISLRQLFSAF